MRNRYHWFINNLENNWEKLKEELNLPLPILKILWQRGYHTKEEIENFLNPKAKDLFSPFLLPDMTKAVERIKFAIKKGEKILIFGDYDVDGITSTAILYTTLRKIGAKVNFIFLTGPKKAMGFPIPQFFMQKAMVITY